MNKRLLLLPFFIFLSIIILFMVQLVKNNRGERPTDLESVLIGKPLPEFTLYTFDGKLQYSKADILNGKPFLITVWATWCPACYQEHQYLNTLALKGIRIVGLNYKDDAQKAKAWLTQLNNPFAINLYDPQGSLAFDLGVSRAPETFLIDHEGIIRYRLAGALDEVIWNETLYPLWQRYAAKEVIE